MIIRRLGISALIILLATTTTYGIQSPGMRPYVAQFVKYNELSALGLITLGGLEKGLGLHWGKTLKEKSAAGKIMSHSGDFVSLGAFGFWFHKFLQRPNARITPFALAAPATAWLGGLGAGYIAGLLKKFSKGGLITLGNSIIQVGAGIGSVCAEKPEIRILCGLVPFLSGALQRIVSETAVRRFITRCKKEDEQPTNVYTNTKADQEDKPNTFYYYLNTYVIPTFGFLGGNTLGNLW